MGVWGRGRKLSQKFPEIDDKLRIAPKMPGQGLTQAILALALRAASPSNSAFLRNCGKPLRGAGQSPAFAGWLRQN